MTIRERILAAGRGETADRFPFFHYWRHSQVGWAERECRNRGMGINWQRPCYREKMHGVEVSTQRLPSADGTRTRTTWKTPVGSVYFEEVADPGVGQWHARRSWNDVSPRQTVHPIKEPADYEVVKYIFENTEYIEDQFPVEQAMDWLGDDGVVMSRLPYSPMHTLLLQMIGTDESRFYFHLADYPDLVEELARTISRCREPLYEMAARSAAPVVVCGDNMDGFLISPNLFEKYYLPEYEKQAAALHGGGKLMAVHMDGRIASLKELIARSPIDIVEGFHPPPMGDLAISEARKAWKGKKAIWLGFLGSVYESGPEATIDYALDMLADMGDGSGVALAMSTENLVTNENLLALTSVLEKAELPLDQDRIAKIREKVRGQRKG